MTLLNRRPDWMFEALRPNEPQIPVDLDEQFIIPTIDAYQQGWSLVNYVEARTDLGPSSPAVNLLMLGPDKTKQRILTDIEVDNEQSAATWNFFLRLANPDTAFILRIARGIYAPAVIPANSITVSHEVLDRPLLIPPGWQLEGFFDGTGVGDTKTTRILVAEIPRGFRPF